MDKLRFNRAQTIVHETLQRQQEEYGKVRALILKARQEGISTYVAARFWHRLSLWPNRVGLIVADHRKRSEVLWDIYQRYSANTPSVLSPTAKNLIRRQEVVLENGSQLAVDTAEDPDLGRAMTVHLLHASELAAWDHAADAWMSVMQAVPPTSGEVIVESTAQGVGNQFHMLWEMAAEKGSEWAAIFLPWWIHEEYLMPCSPSLEEEIREQPDAFEAEALTEGITYNGAPHVLQFEQLAWRRAVIRDNFYGDARMFRQEFPATATEAFLVAGGAFFDADALVAYEKLARDPLARGLMVRKHEATIFSRTERGPLSVYEYPSPGGHYVIGCDTASGQLVAARDLEDAERGGRDFSVAVVADPLRRRVVAEFHARISPEAFADQIMWLGRYYSCWDTHETTRDPALVAVERNHSSGQTTIRRMRDMAYGNLYMHRRLNARYDRPSNNYGWITDGTTRRPMLDGLAEALRDGTLELPSKGLIREMRTFVLANDGEPEAQEGCHDDRVIATAIALEMCRRHRHAVKRGVVAQALKELEEEQMLEEIAAGRL